jgi:hypothetical protein
MPTSGPLGSGEANAYSVPASSSMVTLTESLAGDAFPTDALLASCG